MRRCFVLPVLLLLLLLVLPAQAQRLGTDSSDFLQPGTQPSVVELNDFLDSSLCAQCHGGYRVAGDAPSDAWVASMMAQAARDPVMRAAAVVANADAGASGETCIRCHAPVGWLGGRSTSGDFSNLMPADFDGVSCNVCHRLLDPIARADAPVADAAILAALDVAGTRPAGRCAGGAACESDAECGAHAPCLVRAGQGRFVVDPDDARRGPRVLPVHLHSTTVSPFHSRADACAPCHDVSTPTFTRGAGGTYALNALGAPHPTQDPDEMFPEQRTYSEWRASAFAAGGVVFPDGRFGGTKTAMLPNTVAVSTCQDCHMAAIAQKPCDQGTSHPDVGGHFFAGANSWVLGAVLDEHGAASGLGEAAVVAAASRTADTLAKAADLELTQAGDRLTVRVVNQTGHKLPSGYPEGRRMWIGVRFFAGDATTPIAEDGAYDDATATLDVAHTTKVYEVRQVIGGDVAAAAALPAGTPFHLVLNGVVAFDDRIPPRGFTTAAFDTFGGAPVGHAYADGQYWDDTVYVLPTGTTRVEVSLYHQTTSREYAEFLRDTATGGAGQNAYDRWVARGRSAPVPMVRATLDLAPFCPAAPVPCDDGDPCTTGDVCDGTCHGTVEGVAGARCVLDALASPTACAAALPRALRRQVARRVKKARSLVASWERKAAHGASAGALAKVRKAADRNLAALDKAIGAASHAKPSRAIGAECSTTLRSFVARERDVLARLGS